MQAGPVRLLPEKQSKCRESLQRRRQLKTISQSGGENELFVLVVVVVVVVAVSYCCCFCCCSASWECFLIVYRFGCATCFSLSGIVGEVRVYGILGHLEARALWIAFALLMFSSLNILVLFNPKWIRADFHYALSCLRFILPRMFVTYSPSLATLDTPTVATVALSLL